MASLLISAIFVIVASLYVSALKFLNGEMTSPDLNTMIALETMTRKIASANQAIVDPTGLELKLRIDTNDPATLSTADDQWVTYRFLSGHLRTKTVNPPNAVPADVTSSDPEVVPGLSVLAATGQSSFFMLNPTAQGSPIVVRMQLSVAGNANSQARTLESEVALRSSK